MLKLPITEQTFKTGLLDGHGELEVTADPSLSSLVTGDSPLPEAVKSLGIAGITATSPKLDFGGDGAFKCSAKFSAEAQSGLEVIHPGARSDFLEAYLPAYSVAPGAIAVRFFAKAKGAVSVAGSVPSLPGLTFGVGAGSEVLYSRIVAMPAATPGRAAVLAALTDLRLPQRRGTVADAPVVGEAVVFEYGGFLELKAGLTWGYSLTGTESLDAGGLEASLDYSLRLKAAVSLGYKLAGDFVVVAQPGERPGWVRLTLRKKRDSQFNFPAGFHLDARARLDFAAETVDDVLIAFFGADARRALALFDELREVTDLDALEGRAGKILFGSLQKLSHTWIDRALDRASVADFVAVLRRVVEAHKAIDQRILDLYDDFLKRSQVERLRDVLRQVSALRRKEDLQGANEDVWNIFRRFGGGEIFTLLESSGAFAAVVNLAEQALAFLQSDSELKDLLDRLEADLRLDVIFGKLEKIVSKEMLLNLADRQLQGVVERVVGRSFEELKKTDIGTAFTELQRTLQRINTFREEMIKKLESALNRSVSMEINFAYTRSSSDKALVDLEFDVGTPDGRRLFELAAAGKYAEVLAESNLGVVRVREATLTHQLKQSSQLQINFVGWKLGRLVELVSDTKITLEEHDGGLVQAFTTTASVKQRRERGRSAKEISQTVFMLSVAGQLRSATGAASAHLPYAIATLNRMSVGYEAKFSDDQTSLSEMYEYLMLARWLELIPPSPKDPFPLPVVATPGAVASIDAFIDRLKDEFPGGLGKVTAQYVVRYDDDTLRDAFTASSGAALEERVSQSCRRIIGGHLLTPRENPLRAAIGAVYAGDEKVRALVEQQGANAVTNKTMTVRLPALLGNPLGGRQVVLDPQLGLQFLALYFRVEQTLRKRVRRLDDLVDEARAQKRAVDVREISDAATSLLKSAADLDEIGGVNAFFGVMDDLIQQGRRGKGRRQSSMILEIEPTAGGKVTKFLMAGASQPESRAN